MILKLIDSALVVLFLKFKDILESQKLFFKSRGTEGVKALIEVDIAVMDNVVSYYQWNKFTLEFHIVIRATSLSEKSVTSCHRWNI